MGQMVTTVVFTKDRQRQKNRGGALALECTQDSVQFFRIPEWNWNELDMSLSKFREMVKDREAWHAAVHGVAKT